MEKRKHMSAKRENLLCSIKIYFSPWCGLLLLFQVYSALFVLLLFFYDCTQQKLYIALFMAYLTSVEWSLKKKTDGGPTRIDPEQTNLSSFICYIVLYYYFFKLIYHSY
ncbi:hypothetical protein BX070DRAFT_108029 [Coemansia spiralis]|nr:hypothetical protein BX070DRAFT_108029 [Coemansia spiralis]